MRQIASRDNLHFKALKRLCQSGRERRKRCQALLDGMHLIEAYHQHVGHPVEIIVSESGALHREIADYLAGSGARCSTTVLADALFAEIATVETPSGIMAIILQPKPAHGFNQEVDAILLDGVQDPGNVGSILRSAAAAGFRQVLLSTDCAQAWSPKVLRAAMGAHFQLDIHESCDLTAFLGGYQGQGMVTSLDATTSLYAADLKRPVAWVFGSEGQGVKPEIIEATRQQVRVEQIVRMVRIPMPGSTESLNVAAAAAICLFETVRQRQ
jgi:TrmH family RNA methyltransferase